MKQLKTGCLIFFVLSVLAVVMSNILPSTNSKSPEIIALEKTTLAIPASDHQANIDAYSELLVLDPGNPAYRAKVDRYTELQRVEAMSPEEKKQWEIQQLETKARAIPAGEVYKNRRAYEELLALVPGDSTYAAKVEIYTEKSRLADKAATAKQNKERAKRRAQKRDELKIDAWLTAQKVVEKRLTSPSTADFDDGIFDSQSASRCVTALSGGKYIINGYVDSQNGFGAMVRTYFKVLLEESGDQWKVLDVEM